MNSHNLFKLLSDQTRLRILLLLKNSDLCVCQLTYALDLQQAKISKHLAKLRTAGLVIDERREQFVYYSLNRDEPILSDVLSLVAKKEQHTAIYINDKKSASEKELAIKQCKG